MNKLLLSPVLFGLPFLALPLMPLAHAQNTAKPRTIYFYNASLGRATSSINAATSGPWGNGTVGPAQRVDYEGAKVLQITTRNLQEGARFDFTNPVDLEAYKDTGFLRLRLRFNSGFGGGFGGFGGFGGPGGFGGRGGPGGGAGGFGGFGGGGFGGGGFGGGRGGGGGFGAALVTPRWSGNAQIGPLPPFGGGRGRGGFGAGGGGADPGEFTGPGGQNGGPFGGMPFAPPQSTNIKEIAVTLLRENGATVGRFPVDLRTQTADEDGWRLFILPIKNMTSTQGASGKVTRAIFTSDVEDTFYMAQAALVIESGDMTVSLRRPDDAPGAGPAEIEVKPGGLSLIADVEAGAADPIIEWNFDADNVGNLPPGALSTPAIGQGGEGEDPRGMGPRGGMAAGGGMMIPGRGATGMGGPGMGGAVTEGPRLDARGLTATFNYPNEEQNYRVEVTVRDRNGVKPSVTSSILVKVRG